MKIYFFGGSFDPPHKAHKLIYKHCLNLCDKFMKILRIINNIKKIILKYYELNVTCGYCQEKEKQLISEEIE